MNSNRHYYADLPPSWWRGIKAAAAANLAGWMETANCRGQAHQWNQAEAANTFARSHRQPPPPVVTAALELCIDCPALQQCKAWAAMDNYTGLAAGAAWKEGTMNRAMQFATSAPPN